MTKLRIGPDKRGNVALCENGLVIFYGAASSAPEFEASETLCAKDAEILPGWVCAHTHLYSALVPYGMPAPEHAPNNFLEILERIWWRLDRAIDPEILRISARLYVAESLLKGTTSIVDHHESPNYIEGSLDTLAEAFTEFGARGILCYGATDRNFGLEEGKRGIDECVRFIQENKNPLVKGMVGLHASFTCSEETIKYAAAKALQANVGIHVHVAEAASDVEDAMKRGFSGPAERLEKLGAIVPQSIFVHSIHMSAQEVRQAAKHGVWFVQNPRSNYGNKVGYPLSLTYAQRVALGVDGYNADMEQEMNFGCEEATRQGEDKVNVIHRLYSGWRMMGDFFDAEFGPLNSIENCRRCIRTSAADLRIVDDEGVRHTVVDGKVVVKDRKLVNGDIEALREEAKSQAQRLWKEMAKY
ncbi:MAG: amidohydrolase family protein [Bradymonadales bacterium]|jgi:cytosine/adenosine deaminase-related metal-dependent hydrolase